MPRYRVLEKSFINGGIVEAGVILRYEGQPGANLEPMEGEAAFEPEAQIVVPGVVDTNPLPGIRVREDGKYITIWCAGCKHPHGWIPINGSGEQSWSWNGRTLIPSVRHFVTLPQEEGGGEITTCHYNVVNGRITYHPDSSAHSLRGEHDLQPFPEGDGS